MNICNRSIMNSSETKPLSNDEQKSLFLKLNNLATPEKEKNAIRELLFKKNLRLFSCFSKKYSIFGSIDDIVDKCYKGLYKAIDNYNPSTSSNFSSYAYYWINTEIERKMYETYFDPTKYSKRCFSNLIKYFSKYAKIEEELKEKPSMDKVIDTMNLSKRCKEKLIDMINEYNQLFNKANLDNYIDDNKETTLIDVVPSNIMDPLESLLNDEKYNRIINYLSKYCATNEQKEYILLLLGNNDFADIAKIYNKDKKDIEKELNDVAKKVKSQGASLSVFSF